MCTVGLSLSGRSAGKQFATAPVRKGTGMPDAFFEKKFSHIFQVRTHTCLPLALDTRARMHAWLDGRVLRPSAVESTVPLSTAKEKHFLGAIPPRLWHPQSVRRVPPSVVDAPHTHVGVCRRSFGRVGRAPAASTVPSRTASQRAPTTKTR